MVLVFDVSSEFALFRKPYTTTSQISFGFPPPTAIAGLVSAIIGIDNTASIDAKNAIFWADMQGTQIALSIINPLKWYSTTVNLLFYKSVNGELGNHIQSKHQMLKNPKYRIYLKGEEIFQRLKKCLQKKEFIFTPYLGQANMLAEIDFIGVFEEKSVLDRETFVDSIVPICKDIEIDVSKSASLHREIVPFKKNTRRELEESVNVLYQDILYKEEGKQNRKIWLKNKGSLEVAQVGHERVGWFNAW